MEVSFRDGLFSFIRRQKLDKHPLIRYNKHRKGRCCSLRSAPWSNEDCWIYVDRSGASRAVNTLLGQAQPRSKRPQSRILRSAGREPCSCVPSASPLFSREWLTACLQQTPCREIPGRFYYTDFVGDCQFCCLHFIVFTAFLAVLGRIFPR